MDPSRLGRAFLESRIVYHSKAKRMRSTYYLLIKIEFVSLNIKMQLSLYSINDTFSREKSGISREEK